MPTLQTGFEELAELQLTVDSATSASSLGIRCQVLFLESLTERNVVPANTSAKVFDRTYVSGVLPTTGSVTVIGNSDVGLHVGIVRGSYDTHLVNLAVLNGVRISALLFARGVRSNGQLFTPTGSALGCRSANANALQVNTACTQVYVDGSELTGAQAVPVELSMAAFAHNLSFTVWHPQLPVQLNMRSSTLRPIQGWSVHTGSACAQAYQRSAIEATANFSTGAPDDVITARVTYVVQSLLQSSDPSVATLQGRLVVGNGTGTSTISVGAPAVGLGSLTVSVLDAAATVAITSMQVFVMTDLTMNPGQLSPFALAGRGTDEQLNVSNHLELEDARAGISAYISMADGSRMHVNHGLGVVYSVAPEHQNVVRIPPPTHSAYDPDAVVAVGTGVGPYLQAALITHPACPSAGAGGVVLAQGNGLVSVSTAQPVQIMANTTVSGCSHTVHCTVNGSCTSATAPRGCTLRLTTPSDPLRTLPGALAVAGVIDVYAVFALSDGSLFYKSMSRDSRTLFTTTNDVVLCPTTNASTIVPTCPASAVDGTESDSPAFNATATSVGGAATLTVQFSHVNLSLSLPVAVEVTRLLETTLHPYPEYPGSDLFNVSTLHRYRNEYDVANPRRQQAIGSMIATTNTGRSVQVPDAAFQIVATSITPTIDPTTAIGIAADRIVSVQMDSTQLSVSDYVFDFVGVYGTHEGVATRVRVTDTTVQVAALRDVRFEGDAAGRSFYTLSGLDGVATEQITFGATFSDGTVYPEVVAGGNTTLLPGVFTFTSPGTTALTVDGAGVTTLQGNNELPVAVRVGVQYLPAMPTVTINVACDLLPDVGDVDLGVSGEESPVPSRTVGDTFNVEVRFNTGTDSMGSIDLSVTYPAAAMEVVMSGASPQISTGRQWPGGIFQAVVDPPGTIRLGGVPSAGIRGANAHLATITFRATVAGVHSMTGSVTTFAQGDTAGTAIGGATPRAFVAGTVLMVVRPSTRHRRGVALDLANVPLQVPTPQGLQRVVRQTEVPCAVPPCSTCPTPRQRGDTNGDCVFDIRDVNYIQLYKVAEAFDFETPAGVALNASMIAAQRAELDADADGEVTTADALYLARVNFDLLRFIVSTEIRPVQDEFSNGVISINVTTMRKGDIVDVDSSVVFLDLSHNNASLQPAFNTAHFTKGRRCVLSLIKSSVLEF